MVSTSISYIECRRQTIPSFLGLMEDLENAYVDKELPLSLANETASILHEHALTFTVAGAYRETTGIDCLHLMEQGPPPGTDVGIVIISCNTIQNTQRCIQTLRAKKDARFPQTLYVIDNGSTDGSAEWLEGPGAGPDLHLIRNPFNEGSPRARNQALLAATGHDWICFLPSEVFVTEGWLDRALYHGEVDPCVGAVALGTGQAPEPLTAPATAHSSTCSSGPAAGPGDQASIDALAQAHFAAAPRMGGSCNLVSSTGVLVRSKVLESLGGFDEAFSPSRFEIEDLSLRIRLSGWRNRVARDTYVHDSIPRSQRLADRESAWMRANWNTFLSKWYPESIGSPLMDYSGLNDLKPSQATHAQLRYELPRASAPAPEWKGCVPERGEPSSLTKPSFQIGPQNQEDALLPATPNHPPRGLGSPAQLGSAVSRITQAPTDRRGPASVGPP